MIIPVVFFYKSPGTLIPLLLFYSVTDCVYQDPDEKKYWVI